MLELGKLEKNAGNKFYFKFRVRRVHERSCFSVGPILFTYHMLAIKFYREKGPSHHPTLKIDFKGLKQLVMYKTFNLLIVRCRLQDLHTHKK